MIHHLEMSSEACWLGEIIRHKAWRPSPVCPSIHWRNPLWRKLEVKWPGSSSLGKRKMMEKKVTPTFGQFFCWTFQKKNFEYFLLIFVEDGTASHHEAVFCWRILKHFRMILFVCTQFLLVDSCWTPVGWSIVDDFYFAKVEPCPLSKTHWSELQTFWFSVPFLNAWPYVVAWTTLFF